MNYQWLFLSHQSVVPPLSPVGLLDSELSVLIPAFTASALVFFSDAG